jgi:hypothetical protein
VRVSVTVRVGDALALAVRVFDAVAVDLGVRVSVRVAVALVVRVGMRVRVGVRVGVGVLVPVLVGPAVCDGVFVAVAVGLGGSMPKRDWSTAAITSSTVTRWSPFRSSPGHPSIDTRSSAIATARTSSSIETRPSALQSPPQHCAAAFSTTPSKSVEITGTASTNRYRPTRAIRR